jgi:manganese/iron transport system permease protein/iron/zinc/copper transport system permease protein
MVPQQLVEDILGTIIRREPVLLTDVEAQLKGDGRIRRAVSNLKAQGYLQMNEEGLALTDTGRLEAERILRAHRLWEVYLHRVGTPETEIHSRAENLEHMHDASAVEYLDDLLGHPVKDPHGQEIPEDEACKISGNVVPLSYFRSGREGVIDNVPQSVSFTGLNFGDKVRMKERKDQGKSWVIIKEDGSEVVLDHDAADAIQIRCS